MATVNLAYSRARAGDTEAQLSIIAEAGATAEYSGDHSALMHALRCEADLCQGRGRYE